MNLGRKGAFELIVLASASPRRQELLRQIGCVFRVEASCAVEEKAGMEPRDLVVRNALAKARDVAGRNAGDAVIGADTIVVCDGRIFGKPADALEARDMLASLAGRAHEVYTGIALCAEGRVYSDVVRTKVCLDALTRAEIEAYAATEEPLDKAGAYGIQGRAALFVTAIEGSYSNVVGLPLNALYRLAEKAGVRLV